MIGRDEGSWLIESYRSRDGVFIVLSYLQTKRSRQLYAAFDSKCDGMIKVLDVFQFRQRYGGSLRERCDFVLIDCCIKNDDKDI